MGNLLKRCFMGAVAVLLAVSILFSSVTEKYYAMDAAITYSTWQLWTMVFASLGITIDRVGTLSDEERISEMEATVLDYMDSLENVDSTPLEDARDFVQNIGDYVVDGALTISDSVFDVLRSFVGSEVVSSSSAVVSNLPILMGCTESQFLNLLSGLIGVSSSDSNLIAFVDALFNNIFYRVPSCDYSFIISKVPVSNSTYGDGYCLYYHEIEGSKLSFKNNVLYQTSGSVTSYADASFTFYETGYTAWSNIAKSSNGGSGGSIKYNSDVLMFYINGVPFDLYEMFPSISDGVSDVVKIQSYYNDCLVFTDGLISIVNNIPVCDLSDVYADDAYDVITPGREYDDKKDEVVGDVVLPVPGTSVFDKLENGEITWEEFLEEIGVEPIDTTKGTDLLTGEFLDTQAGILSGVEGVLDFLNGLVEGLTSAFLEMLLSLVVPADGFIEGKIKDLQYKFNSLGIAPYDMSVIFDDGGGGNPFKDITIEVSGKEVVIVSFAYLPKFLNKFRPVFRGLLVLFLLYYSIDQFLSLLQLSGIMEGGNSNPIQIGVGMGSNVPQIADKGGK